MRETTRQKGDDLKPKLGGGREGERESETPLDKRGRPETEAMCGGPYNTIYYPSQ